MACDLAASSDFPCAGLVRTRWVGELDIDECEEHRLRILADIQREWEESTRI